MASKLFHAVVGVGISLGSASACGGSTSSDEWAFETLDATAPETPDAAAPEAPDASANAPPDAAIVDAAPVDAAADVPEDALVAAFCDATWPITKSGREVCGPYDECSSVPAPWCVGPDDQGACKLYPLQCTGGEWHCMGGTPSDVPVWSVESCQ
jgi:hypothetical protein